MALHYHFSVDDVFDSLLRLSDWELDVTGDPVLALCRELGLEGCVTDLYLFRRMQGADGRWRRLDEITERAGEALAACPDLRFGPHAEDYATAPHAQAPAALRDTVEGLLEAIARFAPPAARARWLRLHYFSECFELAPLLASHGVKALLTTDKPAVAYRLDDAHRRVLAATGRADLVVEGAPLAMIRSHLRLESFVAEADDAPRFQARIDAALDMHGFVTLFTHEVDLADARVRRLARTAVAHLLRRGVPAVQRLEP